jgi:hypothetical protein
MALPQPVDAGTPPGPAGPRPFGVRAALDVARREPAAAGLAALAALWCAIRFVALDRVPRGYWMDETLGAIHVRCLAETGRTGGQAWPLFPWAHGGGVFGPTYVYFALGWTRVFGSSMASLRAIAAAANVLTVVGLALIAHRLGGRRFALVAAVAAALSPWSFQFSRIAWDPPLGPMFVVWSMVVLLHARRSLTLALSGLLMALAAYSYTPTRLQAGVWFPLVLAVQWRRGRISGRGALAALAAFATAVAPLVLLMLHGKITARINELSILSPAWREWTRELRGATPEPLFLLFTFLDNVAAHLRPSFLFLWGDANLRHSTHATGVLGAVEALALVLAGAATVRRLGIPEAPALTGAAARDRLPLLLLAGALLGIAPAALCWEGVPHALRAIGAWPFASLLAALVLTRWWSRRRWVGPLLLVVALGYSAFFLSWYFGAYRRIDPRWFHPDLQAAVEADPRRPARESLRAFAGRPGYSWAELQYYLMDHDHLGCDQAAQVAREMWPAGR